ncbi:hypothetical protein [Campylobacter majalis]|nr:hypothetical protein [Campylobacter majalis]
MIILNYYFAKDNTRAKEYFKKACDMGSVLDLGADANKCRQVCDMYDILK